ncbi:hypothetical protein ACLOJK_003925 [Asimina triloba]
MRQQQQQLGLEIFLEEIMRNFQKSEESIRCLRKWRSQSYMQMVPLGGGGHGGGGGDEEDVALFAQENCHSCRTFSYHRLPQQLLRLSVLKLDGSCFEVQIERKASISELKRAIENIFSKSSKEGEGEISWWRQESNIDEEKEEDDCGREDRKPQHHCEKEAMVGHVKLKLTHFLKGCLSHSRLWSRSRRSEGRSHPSKIAGQCVKAGRKMMLL